MKTGLLIALGAYLVLLTGAGMLFPRKNRSLEDFFLAARSLSPGVMALSLCAAWFGASSILISADEACRTGVSAFMIVGLPAVLTVLLFAFFFSGRIHGLPTISLSDLVEARYGRAVRHLATALIVWYMVMLAASQMVAAGQFLKGFLGTSYLVGVASAAAVVFLYATFGGLLSVARADTFQFFLLASGICGLCVSLVGRSSFREAGVLASQAGIRGFFDFFHGAGRNALIALSFTLAWMVSPIAWQRIQAVRTAKQAKTGLLASAGLLAALYTLIVTAGILFRPVLGAPADGSPLLARFIASASNPWLGGLLFVAVMAAILSTLDAAVNTGALCLARDVYEQIFPGSSGRRLVAAGRWSTLFVGGAALAVAFRFQDILKTLGLASQIMAEGLFIPGMAMLFLKKTFPTAGFLSLLLGGGFSLLSFFNDAGIVHLGLPGWPRSVPSGMALSAAGFIIGTGISIIREKRRNPWRSET